MPAQAQQGTVQNHVNQHIGNTQYSNTENVVQENTREEQRQTWQPLSLVFRIILSARNFYWRVADNREWLTRT